MKLGEHAQKGFDEFLRAIESIVAGYQYASFGYLAIREGESFVLSQGRLHLRGSPLQIPSANFESQNVKAGYFKLNESNQTPQQFLEALLSGKAQTPHGQFSFSTNEQKEYSLHFNPFYMEGIQSQQRQMQLMISGGQRPQPNPSKIDWELKAAAIPYDNVQDLCNQYAFGSMNGHQATVEVLAQNIAEIDQKSIVKDSIAHLAMFLADGLDQNKASIGYRLVDKKQIVKRGQILGSQMSWSKLDFVYRGIVEIDVPSGAVLQCFANYSGEAHHFYWVADPLISQNSRRVCHQLFDEKLEILQELLLNSVKGREARDFESAIAWILWMLGFSVAHLGGTPKTSDALDLIATTPQGHFLLVECTTGILKADKLANLIERAEKVRRGIAQSGNAHLRVLPVIVTNKSSVEVKPDLEATEKSGIFVVTRDGFARLIDLTLIVQDPDQLFTQAEERIRRAQNPNSYIGQMTT